MNDYSIEGLMNVAKSYAELDKTLKELKGLETALLLSMDLNALGVARCLEKELNKIQTALAKAAVYQSQLNHLIQK